ncbi:MAG: histidine kinase [Eubacteriales bacterium]|nr:histidine kinase [Eubacteriales bacterium]
MLQKIRNRSQKSAMGIQTKLLIVFLVTSVLIFSVNIYVYMNINRMMVQIDSVYASNANLNELQNTINRVQVCMTEYLNTKSSDAMEDYFRNAEKYRELIGQLNEKIVADETLLMEKNIKNISESYLEATEQAIEYRRGRNVEKYKESYEKASQLYSYVDVGIYSLNNKRFGDNSENYRELMTSMQKAEMTNILILCLTGLMTMTLIGLVTQEITQPLRQLARTANQVAEGNLEVELVEVRTRDEVGVVAYAFNQMIESIREYIERLKRSMELERKMKEKELLMETHLKDAQLKYLQAQINPHFLFNTLNAGAQLAMMEDAEKTYRYVQNVADFFRYSVKKDYGSVTLMEEIELVDSYLYILNVRFSGEIHFQKDVDEELTNASIPAMTLQPVVENCVNHGIRGIDWPGKISLSVYQENDTICVSIRDNGVGMPAEQVERILSGTGGGQDSDKDSNGVGMDNVINRLRLFYGREDVIDITSAGENMGTEVVIYIPIS